MAPPPQLPSATQIAPTDDASISRCTGALAAAFLTAPICLALVCDVDKLTPDSPRSAVNVPRLRIHFQDRISAITKIGAHMVQAGDWSAVAIWEPPNLPDIVDPPNLQCTLRREFIAQNQVVKAKFLGDGPPSAGGEQKMKPHWHLGYLARDPTVPIAPGAISAVVKPFLARAIEDGVPAWLEATEPRAVSIYEHFGFRVVEIITSGVGRYGPDGWPKENGEGLQVWDMIFDRHLTGNV